MSNHAFLKEQKAGTQFSGVYYVAAVSIKKTKAMSEYMEVTLKDKSGMVFAKRWGEVDPNIVKGIYITASVNVETYQNAPSFIIRSAKVYEGEIEIDNYIAKTENSNQLKIEFDNTIQIIKGGNEFLGKIIDTVFTEDFKKAFFAAPSNIGPYYGKDGGALENTMNIVKVSNKLAGVYNLSETDQTILASAAILSRIGCVGAYTIKDCAVEQSLGGALMGNQTLTAIRLSEAWKAITEKTDADKETFQRLVHAVIAAENSNVVPTTKEAILLSSVVSIDSRLVDMFEYIARDEHVEDGFTTYDPTSKRRYFVGTK